MPHRPHLAPRPCLLDELWQAAASGTHAEQPGWRVRVRPTYNPKNSSIEERPLLLLWTDGGTLGAEHLPFVAVRADGKEATVTVPAGEGASAICCALYARLDSALGPWEAERLAYAPAGAAEFPDPAPLAAGVQVELRAREAETEDGKHRVHGTVWLQATHPGGSPLVFRAGPPLPELAALKEWGRAASAWWTAKTAPPPPPAGPLLLQPGLLKKPALRPVLTWLGGQGAPPSFTSSALEVATRAGMPPGEVAGAAAAALEGRVTPHQERSLAAVLVGVLGAEAHAHMGAPGHKDGPPWGAPGAAALAAAKSWQDARPWEPVHPPLARVPTAWLDAPATHLPELFFAYHGPRWRAAPAFWGASALAAGASMGWDAGRLAAMAKAALADLAAPGQRPADDTVRMAVLLGEVLQLVTAEHVYVEDLDDCNQAGQPYDWRRRRVVDKFKDDIGISLSGDCEDAAREVLVLLELLVRDPGTRGEPPLLAALQGVARCYLGLEVFGGVAVSAAELAAARTDPAASVYLAGDVNAHAFVILLPVREANAQLEAANGRAPRRLLDPWPAATLPALLLDGTARGRVTPQAARAEGGHFSPSEAAFRGPAPVEYGPLHDGLRRAGVGRERAVCRTRPGTCVHRYVIWGTSPLSLRERSHQLSAREIVWVTPGQPERYGALVADALGDATLQMVYDYDTDRVAPPPRTPAWVRGRPRLTPSLWLTPLQVQQATTLMGRVRLPLPPLPAPLPWWTPEQAALLGLPPPPAPSTLAGPARLGDRARLLALDLQQRLTKTLQAEGLAPKGVKGAPKDVALVEPDTAPDALVETLRLMGGKHHGLQADAFVYSLRKDVWQLALRVWWD